MNMINILRFAVFGTASLAAPAAIASLIVSAPIDVVGNLPLATFIGDNFSTQKYKDWGNLPPAESHANHRFLSCGAVAQFARVFGCRTAANETATRSTCCGCPLAL